ncbi:SAV_915 family protein [Haloechinothrix sp. LS1_15]|uniref:SAV_915 family protein n=1 Tax=Haloechinothrix sp. LS1_15 TaxID=2652248 RepID=UPI0029472DDA|nr:SAV_915 family protein [Haloechinothrix sp. LS1_15]MDV6011239.1 hypothetical protein [Haloechinothrix sp. LS1_15]
MDAGATLRSLAQAELILLDDLGRCQLGELFVLTTPEGELELRDTQRNECLVVAFTSYASLVTSCGVGQPYAQLHAAELEPVLERLRRTVVVALDVWLPEGHRYPEPDPREVPELAHWPEVPAEGRVWVPARPPRRGDRQVEVELHAQRPDEPLLCVYSSLDALQEACGPYQAAVAIDVAEMEDVARESGAVEIAYEPVLAEHARHTGAP